ncbi:hypothetical protein J1N35_044390 [Gossypium stocksii]|uniref:Glycine-rich protein n=1 Tax=Gossypium stocksii TaxID=47602 RepID=A0A9D3U8Y6_9ROSI|nr:hypothetical protein J1N35_044390 [Gossypium stocksii]
MPLSQLLTPRDDLIFVGSLWAIFEIYSLCIQMGSGKGGGGGGGGSKGSGGGSGGGSGNVGGGSTSKGGGGASGMMVAPGSRGATIISRDAFESNPQGFFAGRHSSEKGNK